jgi:hypothetical protein
MSMGVGHLVKFLHVSLLYRNMYRCFVSFAISYIFQIYFQIVYALAGITSVIKGWRKVTNGEGIKANFALKITLSFLIDIVW